MLKPSSASPLQLEIGYEATGLACTAVVLHVSVPVTFAASPLGLYESGALLGERPERFGAVPYVLDALIVTVRSGVSMMSPWTPSPIRQRAAVHAAPLSAMLVALIAVVGPLIGLPCCAHVEPSFVPITVPIVPSAKQYASLTHAMPLSAFVVPLVCAAHDPVHFRTVPAAPAA